MKENDQSNQATTEMAARDALDSAAAGLARQHRARLDQARRTALTQVSSARPYSTESNAWRTGWAGFAVAAGLGSLILMNTSFQSATQDALPDAAEHFVVFSDLDTLAELDATDYEIIEDLDFAYWLSTQDEDTPDAAHNG